MKRLLEKLFVVAVVLAVVGMATSASAVTLYSGTLTPLTGLSSLDLTGNIVYAINAGGPAVTVGGVNFSADTTAYPAVTNDPTLGSYPGTNATVPGYYPALVFTAGAWNPNTADANVNTLFSSVRYWGNATAITQFDVTVGHNYQVQVLYNGLSENENRADDLAVGSGTAGLSSAELAAWQEANLKGDALMCSPPQIWSDTVTVTTDKLWVADFYRPGVDPAYVYNSTIAGYIVTDLGEVPEPATLTLLGAGLLGLLAYAWRKRK